jgi:hypothetical protein
MTPPRPTALRLWTRARGVRAPAPPFGLRSWSAEGQGEAIAVLVHADGLDVDDPAQVAAQIPHATELPGGTLLFVLGAAVRTRDLLRWLGMRTVPLPRPVRCTALVARGYVDVGAGADPIGAELAWGFSSPC